MLQNTYVHSELNCYNEEPIDVVYTWVNGSDSLFLNDLKKFTTGIGSNVDHSKQRYDDKYELKFSLRSLEKYAPWVRHVYIVTNGQIPYWLNLDYEKVFLVTHEEIFQDARNLPTFSSPAIEGNLHRIPKLSKKFIYFNDDVFLAAPTFKEDFYSDSKGFLVYLAWIVPNCLPNCPWMYVADGQCDKECFKPECQMDGGDCDPTDHKIVSPSFTISTEQTSIADTEYQMKKLALANAIEQVKSNFYNTFLKKFPSPSAGYHSPQNLSISVHLKAPPNISTNAFKKLDFGNLSRVVDMHNKMVLRKDRLRRKSMRKRKVARDINLDIQVNSHVDAYSASLQHTNRMLNWRYGFITRKVPSHAPIMVDKDIMEGLKETFPNEFAVTESNRVRKNDDVQFSLAYYYYLMSEQIERTIEEIFQEFDTDGSGTWSDREIRTLLTKLYELPLSYGIVEHFEAILLNCSVNKELPDVPVPEYERYVDSKLPTISKLLVASCPSLVKMMRERFGSINKHHFDVVSNAENKYVSFKMLNSNISDVVLSLDEIRRTKRKFVCLNDNLDASKLAENELVKAILYDFYLSLFPHPSKFELSEDFRNKFAYVKDLNKWKIAWFGNFRRHCH